MGTHETTAVHALLEHLEDEGVECVFGVPGGALTAFFEALRERSRIRFVLSKHEAGAAFMANTYARVRGGLAVCAVTSGPGATNALTGVAGAHRDGLPVLLLTGQVATRAFGKGAIQESTAFGVDVVQLFAPITKLSAMIPTAERAPEFTRMALRAALTGRRGPVHLSLPADLARQRVSYSRVAPARYRAGAPPSPDRGALRDAAALLAGAERPCILAGHGVALAGASDELRALAEALRVPVATSPKGKGVFPESHPLALGVFGLGGHARAFDHLTTGRVDVLLVVGSSLNEWSSSAWDKSVQPTRALLHADIDADEIGKNYPVDVALVGDARATLRELREAVAAGAGVRARDDDPLRELRARVPRLDDAELCDSDETPLKPQRLMRELRAALPDDGMLCVDNGNSILWGGHYFEARAPGTYFIDLGLACMGSAVGGVVGAKLAAPERAAVALVGDAAFAMNGMEVHTAAEHDVAAIWVVLNNRGHGMVTQGERLLRGEDLGYGTFRAELDVAAMGRALGAHGVRVESPRAFREALDAALARKGPTVIEAMIDASVVPPTLGRRARSLARFFGLPMGTQFGPAGGA